MKKEIIKIENKRIIWLAAIVGLLIAITIFGNLGSVSKSASIIADVENLMQSENPQAIYIMRETCTYCELNKTNIESMVNEYGFNYYNVDTTNLSTTDYDKLLRILNISSNDFGTPYLAVVKKGEVKGRLNGLTSYDELFKFLKDNSLIDKKAKTYLNYISYSDYKKVIKSKTNEVIVLATSSCKYCLAEQPVLIDLAKETGAKINYFYLDKNLTSEDVYNEFMNSLTWFSENTKWGTPTTLIVRDGKVVKYLEGYRDLNALKEFYRENEIID